MSSIEVADAGSGYKASVVCKQNASILYDVLIFLWVGRQASSWSAAWRVVPISATCAEQHASSLSELIARAIDSEHRFLQSEMLTQRGSRVAELSVYTTE